MQIEKGVNTFAFTFVSNILYTSQGFQRAESATSRPSVKAPQLIHTVPSRCLHGGMDASPAAWSLTSEPVEPREQPGTT